MPTKYTVTITALGTSSVIVLPKPVVDGFNLAKGHRLALIVKDDGIYIPLTEQPADSSNSYKYNNNSSD
ncbi:MAG: AbrB/MazE/SpoVT family DNA-binding domain-containing protein [Nitrososphaeraceae archaeon]|jgi:bifunctional DNA-binding transcriptional regulator/antitoxin component of YhaV-PrlF toxin-antitoxin module